MADVARLIVAVGAQTRDLEAAFARSTRVVSGFDDRVARLGEKGNKFSNLRKEVNLLAKASKFGLADTSSLDRAIALERQYKASAADTNRSLEERVKFARMAQSLSTVGAQSSNLNKRFEESTRRLRAFADGAQAVGSSLSQNVTLPIAGMGVAVFAATAKMDSLTRGLEAVAGSASGAQRQLARLTEIAKAPGIGFAEAIQGSVRLQSVGFSARNAERSLKAFANAIALTGGNRENLERVTVQLGQMASKGKVLAQDIRPIIENAPAFGRALREAFGTTDTEAIQKLGLTMDQFLDRVLGQLEKLPQVTGGLGNAFDNLKDSIFRALATAGEDQAGALTSTLNSLASRVESLAKTYAALNPFQQKVALGFVAAAAAAGPLLIAVSALANAYRTLMAISLVSSVMASIRAFVAQAAAVRSAAAAMQVATVAGRGLLATLMGPAGIALALGGAAYAFIAYKNRVAEAAAANDRFAQSLTDLNKAGLQGVRAQLVLNLADIKNLQQQAIAAGANVTEAARERGSPVSEFFRQMGRQGTRLRAPVPGAKVTDDLRALNQEVGQLEGRIKAVDEALKGFSEDTSLGLGGSDTGDDGDKFKALRKQVDTIAEGIRLRLDDNALIGLGLALERQLSAQAGDTNRALEDRVTLLNLANTLADAARGRLEAPDVNLTPATGRDPTAFISAGLAVINREGEPARRKLKAMADEAARIQKNIEKLDNLTRFVDSLSRALSNFGGFGRGLAETVSRVGDLTDALRALRQAQADAEAQGGTKSIFNSLGSFGASLGVIGAGFSLLKGALGGLFGGGGDKAAEENRRRLDANTDAMDRLASRLNALAGTADEARRAQIAAGRLAASAGDIGTAGLLGKGTQLNFVNKLIADLGITFGDLKRIASDLGIEILKENGKVASDALNELAKALGYHADIITKLADDVSTFRTVQDAAAKLYNLEDTPQRALNDALAELRKFAPELMGGLLSGIDTSSGAGRQALQKALQALFERIRPGSANPLGLSDLGAFTDVAALLESILRADGALDRFSESASKATAAMLNVPAGFKVAPAAFQASAADRYRSAPSLPTPSSSGGQQGASQPVQVLQFASGAVPVQIVTSADGRETYANFYDEVGRLATSNVAMRAFHASLSPPSRN